MRSASKRNTQRATSRKAACDMSETAHPSAVMVLGVSKQPTASSPGGDTVEPKSRPSLWPTS